MGFGPQGLDISGAALYGTAMARTNPEHRQSFRASGLEVNPEQIELIAEVVTSCSGLSRNELAGTVCELLGFQRPSGRLKTRECRDLLEGLHNAGQIQLPGKAPGRPQGSTTVVARTRQGEAGEPISGTVRELRPVRLELVSRPSQRALWRELVDRYHYLGFRTPYGASLCYLVKIRRPREAVVGCLQFSSPAWRLRARDQWIGWTEAQRRQHLQRVVNQSRFLILPWVQVQNLASHVLALAARQLSSDWFQHFGIRPCLLETLVDAHRFQGTCYRAANWISVGLTSGRGRMDREHQRHGAAPKHCLLYPLVAHARRQLREDCEPGGERQ